MESNGTSILNFTPHLYWKSVTLCVAQLLNDSIVVVHIRWVVGGWVVYGFGTNKVISWAETGIRASQQCKIEKWLPPGIYNFQALILFLVKTELL